jgi:hypothetical protein
MKKIKLYTESNTINYITENLDYEVASFDDCDYILSSKFIFGLYDSNAIQNLINSYKNINKKVIIFLVSDITNKLYIPNNVILFRTSLYKSLISNNEYILPYVWEKIDKPFNILKKTIKPIIGFCGKVDVHRINTINILKNNNNLTTNFIVRKDFWGGKPNDQTLFDEFSDNIINSHFTVCNRGRGNFSMRFYQTLSYGRIPVLINTDMVFPFDDEIDWNSIIIIGNDENEIINKILSWWNNKDIDIEKIQLKCKEVYDTFLYQKKYFNKIFSYIENKKIDFKSYDNLIDYYIYSLYNDLNKMNKNQLKNHYINHGIKENRLIKLPKNFDINIYKKYNNDLSSMTNNELIKHFVNYGYYEDRKYNEM